MTVTEMDLEAIFAASSGTEWTVNESIQDMRTDGSFRHRAKGRNLDQKQFQTVMLKLTLAANKEESSELTAPVSHLLCAATGSPLRICTISTVRSFTPRENAFLHACSRVGVDLDMGVCRSCKCIWSRRCSR